ncbi:MAG: hypothetical protein QNJ20_13685 [Paracoccaceae bacterium]|nr:hypothetical protein [Paracoccaceae bacterium]
MSDFMAAFLVLLALAAVGNFATTPDVINSNCAGSIFQFCW